MKQTHAFPPGPRCQLTTTLAKPFAYLWHNGFGSMLCRAIFVMLFLSAAHFAHAADYPVVREVLISRDGNGARIDIRANQPLLHRSYLMSGLEKWVVDLPGARTTFAGDESKKVRTLPLDRITVRQKDVNGDPLTRIGLDFKGEVDFSLTVDPLDKGHLIISMKPSPASPQKREAEHSPSPAAKTLPGLPLK